jgi:hypothetical protein
MSQSVLLHIPVAKLYLQRCRLILTDYHHLRIIATTPDDVLPLLKLNPKKSRNVNRNKLTNAITSDLFVKDAVKEHTRPGANKTNWA